MKTEEFENFEEQKDFAISDALVTIQNSVILGQNYIENKEDTPALTPLCMVFEQIEKALEKLKPYYDVLDCIK